MARILIAEDDQRIASFLKKGLRASGFSVSVVTDGHAAARASDTEFDLMILDLGLPGLDGLDALKELRKRGEEIPVIILTAQDAVSHRVRGLEHGADDYVTKPFSLEELVARIRVRLRDDHRSELIVLKVDDVELDLRTRRVKSGEQWMELTAREFALMETFMRHAGQVLSREQILNHVWGYDFDTESNVVEVYVRYLRKKLGDERIETVRGMGYRLRDVIDKEPVQARGGTS